MYSVDQRNHSQSFLKIITDSTKDISYVCSHIQIKLILLQQTQVITLLQHFFLNVTFNLHFLKK